jgi:hypothetical protein
MSIRIGFSGGTAYYGNCLLRRSRLQGREPATRGRQVGGRPFQERAP